MKNIIYFAIIIACVGLIYFGFTHKTEPQTTQAPAGSGQAVSPNTASNPIATPTPAAIGQVAQHFRPDTAAPAATEGSGSSPTSAQTAEKNFQLTPDLIAKMYLIDTYKPGTCFGAPVAAPQIAVTNLVAANPPLSNFLKVKYSLKTDLEIYNKLKQLQGVTLTETASSKYNFAFMDGQCQNVTYYEGTVTVSGGTANALVTSQTSHTYQ